jgi:hypothetical protein
LQRYHAIRPFDAAMALQPKHDRKTVIAQAAPAHQPASTSVGQWTPR